MTQQNPQLDWARILLFNIINGKGETMYRHSNGPVWWGPYDNQKYYLSITDCSGFVNALLKRSYNLTNNDFSTWFRTARPYASTYYKMINEQRGFIKFDNIHNVQLGDFIVFKFPPGTSKGDDTGHIVLVNQKPVRIVPTMPYEQNLLQWRVNIIDQTGSPHGPYDTRYHSGKTGLGSGDIRIYTDALGKIAGYSWSLNPNSKYVDHEYHPILVGRVNIQ